MTAVVIPRISRAGTRDTLHTPASIGRQVLREDDESALDKRPEGDEARADNTQIHLDDSPPTRLAQAIHGIQDIEFIIIDKPEDASEEGQDPETEDKTEADLVSAGHTHGPDDGEGHEEQYRVRGDIEARVCHVEASIVDVGGRFDVDVPVGGEGEALAEARDSRTDGVACVGEDEEVAEEAEPLLDEDTVVEEDEGDAGDWVGDCVEDVPCVVGLCVF